MGLTITSRNVDSVSIIDMSGDLVARDSSALRETIEKLLSSGERKFVLNLAGVSYIDSSGLGQLIWAYTTVRHQNGDVKLLNLTKRVQDVMQLTKLLTVFDVFDSESRAVGALTGWPGHHQRLST